VANLLRDPVIAERLRNNPELAAQRQEIETEVLAGSTAATKILKYLKTPPPRLSPCDIAAIVELSTHAKRAVWDGKITVSFSQQADLPLVYADPDQMRDVFDNLLSNAGQAMPEGGTVTLSIAPASGLLDGGANRYVDVSVGDTGIGIPPEDLPRLFEPNFSRTPGGTGIGLALAKEIVARHGGDIVVQSTVGVGSTFVVRLPAERTSSE
jgi:signal transduction histidine kinase